jgi:hypothetical protein
VKSIEFPIIDFETVKDDLFLNRTCKFVIIYIDSYYESLLNICNEYIKSYCNTKKIIFKHNIIKQYKNFIYTLINYKTCFISIESIEKYNLNNMFLPSLTQNNIYTICNIEKRFSIQTGNAFFMNIYHIPNINKIYNQIRYSHLIKYSHMIPHIHYHFNDIFIDDIKLLIDRTNILINNTWFFTCEHDIIYYFEMNKMIREHPHLFEIVNELEPIITCLDTTEGIAYVV